MLCISRWPEHCNLRVCFYSNEILGDQTQNAGPESAVVETFFPGVANHGGRKPRGRLVLWNDAFLTGPTPGCDPS